MISCYEATNKTCQLPFLQVQNPLKNGCVVCGQIFYKVSGDSYSIKILLAHSIKKLHHSKIFNWQSRSMVCFRLKSQRTTDATGRVQKIFKLL